MYNALEQVRARSNGVIRVILTDTLFARVSRPRRRFCQMDEIVGISQHPFCRGSAFADNAKQLLIPLLGMPSNNVVAALLFLAYYELGMNNEAGEQMSPMLGWTTR